jgi:GntR family transcriptional regulator, arabinose operon transcriptional repressor
VQNIIDKTNIRPVYLQLEDKLKKDITYGSIKPGGKMPSENALSRKYGIHRHTARKTLKLLAESGVIVSEPGRGWFVKENISSHLAITARSNQRTSTVGLYGIPMGNIHSGFTSSLINALYSFGEKSNCSLKILNEEDICQLESKGDCGHDLDCLYWIAPNPEDISRIGKIKNKGMNVLVANRQLFGTDIPYVAIDQYSGTRELVARLTRYGHKKIGCITSDLPYRYVSERWRGFSDALNDAGIEIEESRVMHILDSDNFKDKLGDFFAKNKDMTGLFIAGEVFQKQTFEFISKNNIQIPEDISVIAFDRLVQTSKGTKIVCLEQPFNEMAKSLYDILEKILNDEKDISNEIIKPVICQGNSIKQI